MLGTILTLKSLSVHFVDYDSTVIAVVVAGAVASVVVFFIVAAVFSKLYVKHIKLRYREMLNVLFVCWLNAI